MQNNKFDGSEYQDAFGGAKKIHQAIPIPPELGGRVGAALSSARPGHGMAWRKTAVSAAAVLALFIISVNASPADSDRGAVGQQHRPCGAGSPREP